MKKRQLEEDVNPRIVLLSDRGVNANNAPLPALLALAAVWKSMVKAGRWSVPLIIETGQVVDTHHLALLIAAGASAVLPYAALEQAAKLRPDGVAAYRLAVEKGLRKVMARMGISTIASYRNSQLFETIGLDEDLRARSSKMPAALSVARDSTISTKIALSDMRPHSKLKIPSCEISVCTAFAKTVNTTAHRPS